MKVNKTQLSRMPAALQDRLKAARLAKSIQSQKEVFSVSARLKKIKGKAAPAVPIIHSRPVMGASVARTLKNQKKPSVHSQILQSIKQAMVQSQQSPQSITLFFKGARLYTLNQLFAIMQYHKYHIFAYKKACHAAIMDAMTTLQPHKLQPPFRIYLYRRGRKKVDNDALSAMFKYFIDGLMESKIIEDDNPDIIREYVLFQEKGEPAIGIKLECIQGLPRHPSEVFPDAA